MKYKKRNENNLSPPSLCTLWCITCRSTCGNIGQMFFTTFSLEFVPLLFMYPMVYHLPKHLWEYWATVLHNFLFMPLFICSHAPINEQSPPHNKNCSPLNIDFFFFKPPQRKSLLISQLNQ
jgi:hypothetical protein